MDFKLICDVARAMAPNIYAGQLRQYRNDIAAKLQAINLAEHNLEKYKYTPLADIFDGKYAFDISHFQEQIHEFAYYGVKPETVNGHYLDYDFISERHGYYLGSIGTASVRKRFRPVVRKYLGKVADADDFPAVLSLAASVTGMFVYVAPNVVAAKPLVITNYYDVKKPSLAITNNLIVLGENSRAEVIVRNIAKNSPPILSNVLTETVIGKNANLDIVHITQGSSHKKSKMVFTDSYLQEENSVLTHTNLTAGGSLIRRNIETRLGRNCDTRLMGLTLAAETDHIDNHTFIDHAMPSATSNQLYKSIVCNNAVSVFNGRIRVCEDAQNTAAYQLSKNMLLHDEAKCYAKPQLEIHADDVKCSHGATVGQMDRDALFYLQSRGIDVRTAQSLILSGFVGECIKHVYNLTTKEMINEIIENFMTKHVRNM
ncbi:MAG: Fe-S cluster assembly protein SufD [Prevotellaceae bacterium]|jgi:Fe-S cluster assembly protein SufD|nr:Fe-S cluster assembly protein SufD [Prevotellaceae bacterium]